MRARASTLISCVLLLVLAAALPRVHADEGEWADDVPSRAPAALTEKYPFLKEKAVPDQPLKQRLTERRVYTVQPGDTLRKVAHLLYGHRTWWKRVKEDNRHFRSYRPDDILPPGKSIEYRAPKIGKEYVVQKDDWLIRIALWKYGKTEFWQKLHAKNKDRIRNPDLIHPGDRLRFHSDGTIRVAGSNKVVLNGVSGAKPRPAPEKAPAVRESAPTVESAPVFGVTREEYGTAPNRVTDEDDSMPVGQPRAAAPGLGDAPITADPWRESRPAGKDVATAPGARGPSSDETDDWWTGWPARAVFLFLLVLLGWAGFAYVRSSDLILYPKRGFRGYAHDRKPPKPTRGPYDDLSLDEDFLDESAIDRIDIRPRPNYQSLWKVWVKKRLRRLGKNGNS